MMGLPFLKGGLFQIREASAGDRQSKCDSLPLKSIYTVRFDPLHTSS